MTIIDDFQRLQSRHDCFKHLSNQPGPIGFLGQEALRFHSIAGTLKDNGMVGNSSVDERYISHILARSLIENFFWIVYIFDNPADRQSRYNQLVNLFKREYEKFYAENLQINRDLSAPGQGWRRLQNDLDIKSMISQVRNNSGNRLDPLYAIYRIASFDTHGRSLNNIIETALGVNSPNFPALNLDNGFNLIANHYLVTLCQLEAEMDLNVCTSCSILTEANDAVP